MSTVAKKLQIKPNSRVLLAGAPATFAALLDPLPEGAALATRGTGPFDVVVAFVEKRARVAAVARRAEAAISPGGALWICWPKLAAKTKSDLTRDVLFEAALAAGLRAVTNVALDDTWSALRFRPLAAFERERAGKRR